MRTYDQKLADFLTSLQLERAGRPGPKAIGIDEISIRKGHSYRIVVSDLVRKRPIWFGGTRRASFRVSG